MAWPLLPQQALGKGVQASDVDKQTDWGLPCDFALEQCTDTPGNSQEAHGRGFMSFDLSSFEASSTPFSFGDYPVSTQIPNPQQETVDPTLLSQHNWPSSGTDSTSSSFGSRLSGFQNHPSTSSLGSCSINSGLCSQRLEFDSFNTSNPNKRRYCERSAEEAGPSASQVQLVHSDTSLDMEIDPTAISIFESWLSTCPSIYPEDSDFRNLAALTKLEVGIVKSWFARKLRARRIDDSMFETWLSSYPSTYPGDEEFKSLADLTRLNLDTVRLWFAQKLRCKMSTSQLNNESSATGYSGVGTNSSRHFGLPAMNAQHQPSILQRAASWVKQEREPKCIASLDQSILLRDDNKRCQCTRKCGKKFRDRDDWRKHEEVNWPQEGWVCDLPAVVLVAGIQICTHCEVPNPDMDHFQTHKKSTCNNKAFTTRGRLHHRKQHFLQHFDNVHPHVPCDDYVRNSHFSVESNFPRWCGFCRHKFVHWKDRVEHIGVHFHDEGKDMTEWSDRPGAGHESGSQEHDKGGDDDEDPDDASDSSDDDSDDLPPRSAPKRPTQSKTSCSRGQPGATATDSRNGMQRPGLAMFGKSFETRFSRTPRSEKSVEQPFLHRSHPPSDTVAGHLGYDMAKFLDTLETPPYARMKVLGCGPYSVVDEVRNLATGAVFARKTITFPKSREPSLFMTEVKIMKKLDHPHIVRFVDTYTLDKSVSILMSPVADFDLGDLMNKYPTAELIPVDTIIQWFGCLVSSVKYLHGKSIKHQDIKPSNILIKGQMIFLADFGIAKIFMDSDSTTSTSGDMTMKYCSPETALRGLRGRKADVFSLGCVFLEMFNLLIPQGRAKFEHFQERHSIGGGTYHENLRMVELWIGVLRQEPAFEGDSILWQLLDTCQAMLGESREDRPSAADLYATLPAGKCCLLAEKEFDSKSALEEKQSASSNTPLAPFHSSPQPAHLADQMPTTNEQSSQQMQVSGHGRELLPSQMPHNSMRSESLCSECNNCGPSWGLILGKTAGSYVPRVWIILTLIGCLLLVLVNSHFPLRETGSYGSQVHILTKVVVISRVNPESSPRELSVVDAIPTALLEPRTPIKRLSEAPAFGRDILPRSPPSVDPSFEIILSGPTFQYLRELRKLWGETDMVRQICRDHKCFDEADADPILPWCASTNYWATSHPSKPNNMAVLEAETLGVDDDHLDIFSTHCVSTIVDLLDEKGFSWREYQEDMPYACPSGFKFSNKPQDSPLLINRAIGSGPNSTLLALTNNFTSNPNFAAETVPQSSPRTLNMTNDGHYIAFSRGVAPGKVNVVVSIAAYLSAEIFGAYCNMCVSLGTRIQSGQGRRQCWNRSNGNDVSPHSNDNRSIDNRATQLMINNHL